MLMCVQDLRSFSYNTKLVSGGELWYSPRENGGLQSLEHTQLYGLVRVLP